MIRKELVFYQLLLLLIAVNGCIVSAVSDKLSVGGSNQGGLFYNKNAFVLENVQLFRCYFKYFQKANHCLINDEILGGILFFIFFTNTFVFVSKNEHLPYVD